MEVLIRLTLSGSAMAMLLLALRYVLLKKMPSTVYYYAWLLVLLRFVLPLPGLIPAFGTQDAAPSPAAVSAAPPRQTLEPPLPAAPAGGFAPVVSLGVVPAETAEEATAPAQITEAKNHYVNLRSPELWLTVWAAGSMLCLAFFAASYMFFTARVRRSLSPAPLSDRRVYAALPGHKPRLYRCAAFNTPLMFGVLHPLITLPERVYDEELLTNILRHELMHYRRRDPLYKWFAVAVLSTQWFNPLAWLIRRELNRACELSCDELLLRGMDRAEKLSYGNTLLSMASAGALPAGVVATTFSTEKRNLKERLEQIMNYKKSGARLIAAVLSLVLLAGCGIAAGPAASGVIPAAQSGSTVRVSTVDELLNAIAPNTTIELAAGTYDLSSAKNYGEDTHSSWYSWNGVYDGYELVLHNVRNLTIRGAGMDETTIAAVPRYANVLRFSVCQRVKVEALTAGHTAKPGFCTGGVLDFDGCDNAEVDACGLYGCGILGVRGRDCNVLTIRNSDIYECSYGAVSVSQCRDVRVENCNVHDHGGKPGQGDAMFLFDVNYSDSVTIHKNRIHSNSAQYLLNSDYSRRVLFLSNEVTSNLFPAKVFSFTGYGATVDGCVFEGNDVSHGWYSSSGVYAFNVQGEALEGAMLAEMTLQDLNPDDVAPPVAPSGSMELPTGSTVTVTNVDEFLTALGPDRTIILDGELFDLSTASNYGGIGTDCYYWAENFDGPQLVIHDVSGLAIQAKNTESGATTLAAIPRYADVISFRNCDNLFLGGFTAGHTKEPGACSGGVLNFQNCNGVMLEKMRLFGCGILGIQASQCTSLDILRTEIYECSQGAGQFFQTDGIRFRDCDIHDVPSPALNFHESGDKTWNGEPINGLDGRYDVGADGALVACSIEGGREGEILAIPTDSPEYAFLSEMQKAIAEADWQTLADNMAFPLTIIIPSEKGETNYVHIPDKETFLSRELDQIMNVPYRRYVENAQLDNVSRTIWGYAALDDALCFEAYPDDAPKVTALIINAARVMGDTQGLESLTPYVFTGSGVNPYENEPPIPFTEGTPQLTFARAVQKAFAEQDWDTLTGMIAFPLHVFTIENHFIVEGMEQFQSMVQDPNTPITPAFCELIANADLASYGESIFGSTFAAHRLSFVCVHDTLHTADDLRLNCISVDEPLYRYQGGNTVQSVPPTPMPEGIRVLFFETEIKTDFTLWPGDPIALRAEVTPQGSPITWESDHPDILRIEPTGADSARVSCVDDGSLPQTCKLTVRCGELVKELTVYCRRG